MPKVKLNPGGNFGVKLDDGTRIKMRPGQIATLPQDVIDRHEGRFTTVAGNAPVTATVKEPSGDTE